MVPVLGGVYGMEDVVEVFNVLFTVMVQYQVELFEGCMVRL